MAKSKKAAVLSLICVIALCIGAFALSACSKKELNVTFSIEGKTEVVSVVDGKVSSMPANPTKDFYEFRGWYTTATFDEGTEFTKDTEVKKNMTVYAYFVAIPVDVSVNGAEATEIKLADLSVKTAEFEKDAASQNLTFSGWYIDKAYTTAYEGQKTDNLYARYVAQVQFDNGHEILADFTENLVVGSKIGMPKAEDIALYYMDKEDISFVDVNGNAFDFTKEINVNTKIIVKWKTPGFKYELGKDGTYVLNGFENDDLRWASREFPAFSALSKVTVKNAEGEYVKVDVSVANIGYLPSEKCKTVLIDEGIKMVGGLSNSVSVEKIVLPKSLKIVVDSFNGTPNLKDFTIPDGVEVVIHSFWESPMFNNDMYDFKIAIPDSVINLSMVPSNLTFGEKSVFFAEDNRIFMKKDNGLVLIADTNVDKDGMIIVPDKVQGKDIVSIQVGAFDKIDFKILSLPSTWKEVNYNVTAENYSFAFGGFFYEPDYAEDPSSSTMIFNAYTVVAKLEKTEHVFVRSATLPESIPAYALSGYVSGDVVPYTHQKLDGKVLFTGEVEKGKDIVVKIDVVNNILNSVKKVSISGKVSGDTITKADLIAAAKLDSLGYKYEVKSIKVIDKEFKDGAVTTNQYITLVYTIVAEGFNYEDDKNGGYIVTGFNKDTAVKLDNGLYLVIIPDTVGGKPVTAIKEGAFKGQESLSQIYIGSNIKTIGAESFMNAANLKEVRVSDFGKLETIGRSAFENVGCSVGTDGKIVRNNETLMQIPLKNLKTLEPYAFKSMAIATFTPVESESGNARLLFKMWNWGASPAWVNPDLKEGDFFYTWADDSSLYGIAQYVGMTKEEVSVGLDPATNKPKAETTTVRVCDVKYYATAGGTGGWGAGGYFCVGFSGRLKPSWGYGDVIMRQEVMEGSVYFLNDGFHNGISFGSITKVHKNAFTDMMNAESAYYYSYETVDGIETWITKDQVINQDSAIFEEGWYDGRANSENTFMKEAEINETERNMC